MGFKEDWGVSPTEAIIGAIKEKLGMLPKEEREEMEKKVRDSVVVVDDKDKYFMDPEKTPWENFRDSLLHFEVDQKKLAENGLLAAGIILLIIMVFKD